MSSRACWVARIRLGLRCFQLTFADFLHRRPPQTFACGFILSCAWFPSRVLELSPPVASRRRAPSLGFLPPSRHVSLGVHSHQDLLSLALTSQASQACFVPPSTFRTSSTVCSSKSLVGLFHPTATSGVHSAGVSPPTEPHELTTRRCPLDVAQTSPAPVLSMAEETCGRLQGFALRVSPLLAEVV